MEIEISQEAMLRKIDELAAKLARTELVVAALMNRLEQQAPTADLEQETPAEPTES